MARDRHARRFALLLWQVADGSWAAQHAHADPDFAPALELRARREVERIEALERSDRMDRWWQVFCKRHGPH